MSASASAAPGVLDGIRVLDLTRDLSGPLTSMMLAENGADVVEVEHPRTGDETRSWPPMTEGGLSGYFAAVNRSKRGVAVDLKNPAVREIVYELAARSDVVMQSFTPGVADRLEVGYEAISRVNPAVVYYSLSGFGQDGPDRTRRGYDPIMQAVSGYMSVMGEKGGPPVKSMIPVADLATAIHGYGAIVGALFRRDRTGGQVGQHIDMAMMDVMVSTLTVVAAKYLITGEVPRRSGTENPQRVPSAAFECSDGRFLQAVPNQRQWPAFVAALGEPGWAEDPRFATPVARTKNQDLLYPLVRTAMKQRSSDEWRAVFDAIGVACGPINDLADVFADSQVRHRQMLQSFQFPGVGDVPAVALPFRYSHASSGIRRRPPLLGEHTEEILRELGRSPEQIEDLVRSGAVRVASPVRTATI